MKAETIDCRALEHPARTSSREEMEAERDRLIMERDRLLVKREVIRRKALELKVRMESTWGTPRRLLARELAAAAIRSKRVNIWIAEIDRRRAEIEREFARDLWRDRKQAYAVRFVAAARGLLPRETYLAIWEVVHAAPESPTPDPGAAT